MMCALRPASASAPEGSGTERVSGGLAKGRLSLPTLEDVLDTSADLVVVDNDDTVNELLADAEGLLADETNGRAVGKRSHLVEKNALAGLERAVHGVAVDRLDAKHLGLGTGHTLQVRGDAGQQATTANGGEHAVEAVGVGDLPADLHADGALARDDVGVVVGRDEGQALLLGTAETLGLGGVKVVAVEHGIAAQPAHIVHLDARRGQWHDDGRRDAERLARQGDALRVVSGTAGDDTLLLLLLGQARHHVVRAADLEGEDGLQVLALEPDLAAQPLGQVGGVGQGSLLEVERGRVDLGWGFSIVP